MAAIWRTNVAVIGRTAGIGDRGPAFDYSPHVGQVTFAGLRADTVSDGAEALQALESIPYDRLLMDPSAPWKTEETSLGLPKPLRFYTLLSGIKIDWLILFNSFRTNSDGNFIVSSTASIFASSASAKLPSAYIPMTSKSSSVCFCWSVNPVKFIGEILI